MMSRLRTSAGRSEPPLRSIAMTRRTESGRSVCPVPRSAISSSKTRTAKALSAGCPVTAISLPRTWTSASTSSSTSRRSSSPEPSRATIDTDSGTVMVARTAAGGGPGGGVGDWAGGGGGSGEWSGGLSGGPEVAVRRCGLRRSLTGHRGARYGDVRGGVGQEPSTLPSCGGDADGPSLPAPTTRNPGSPPGSAPRVGRLPGAFAEEGRHRATQVRRAEQGAGHLRDQHVRGLHALPDGGGHELLRGRVGKGRARGDLARE